VIQLIINIRISERCSYRNFAKYIIETSFDYLGISVYFSQNLDIISKERKDTIVIFYGTIDDCNNLSGPCIIIPMDSQSVDRFLNGDFKPFSNYIELTDNVLEKKTRDNASIYELDKKNNRIIFKFDLVAVMALFYSFSEETNVSSHDSFGRFQYRKSWLSEKDKILFPWTNIFSRFMESAIHELSVLNKYILIQIYPWPNGKTMGTCLTHDIDYVYRTYLRKSLYMTLMSIKSFLKFNWSNSFNLFKEAWKGFFKDRNEYFTFDDILETEKTRNVTSTFFFYGGNSKGRHNPDYTINDEKIRQIMLKIIDNGMEIGIHGGWGTSNDAKMLAEEKITLEKVLSAPITGGRQHSLLLNIPHTWMNHHMANLDYDSTYGFAEMIGFRGGIGFPFFPYSNEDGKKIPLLEIPLNVMDTTLIHYLDLSTNESFTKISKLLKNSSEYNPLITFLWHNDKFSKKEYMNWRNLYLDIIDLLKMNNCHFFTATALLNWILCRKTTRISIIKKKRTWVVRIHSGKVKIDNMMFKLICPEDYTVYPLDKTIKISKKNSTYDILLPFLGSNEKLQILEISSTCHR